MSKHQDLEISISPTGDVELKVLGADGSSCLLVTKALEEALGVVISHEKTSEYYNEAPVEEIQKEKRF